MSDLVLSFLRSLIIPPVSHLYINQISTSYIFYILYVAIRLNITVGVTIIYSYC
ncbi:hypothetical protein Mpsy_2235 [Methanolobus psychrophilus R15]|nr:hypothetical protein Mpsy_2235 [Methanolobus psychrophilus R15]